MKHRASKSLGVRCFPCPLSSHCLPNRKRKRFLASARNDDAGRRHTPSFPWKEVPRRGGGWLSKRDFHTRGCQPRRASLVCPFQRKGREQFLIGHRPIYNCSEAATSALSPSCQSTHSTFLPPSHGRRYPEGAEVGSLSGMKKWEAPLIGHGGKAATLSHKKQAIFYHEKMACFFTMSVPYRRPSAYLFPANGRRW